MVRFHDGGHGTQQSGQEVRWDPLVRRILVAAGPELDRLRKKVSLVAQFDLWTRPLLPLAAALILFFGSALFWPWGESELEAEDLPLLAEVLVPEPLGMWLETGERYTLAEFVQSLEEVEE
jgi:hypothetical protein